MKLLNGWIAQMQLDSAGKVRIRVEDGKGQLADVILARENMPKVTVGDKFMLALEPAPPEEPADAGPSNA